MQADSGFSCTCSAYRIIDCGEELFILSRSGINNTDEEFTTIDAMIQWLRELYYGLEIELIYDVNEFDDELRIANTMYLWKRVENDDDSISYVTMINT